MIRNEELIVEKLSKKYYKSKKFIMLLLKICKDNNIDNAEKYIEKSML